MKSSTAQRVVTWSIALILLFSIIAPVLADDTTNPLIEFLEPTPDNNDYQTERYVNINVSIEEENLDALKYNWDGINYTIYDDSLILMYNFDNIAIIGEDSSTIVDMSSNENTGSVDGAIWDSSGRSNGAFDFDGEDDYIDVTGVKDLINGVSAITLSLWVKSDEIGTDKGMIIGKEVDGHDDVLSIRYDVDGLSGNQDNVIKVGLTTTVTGITQIESSASVQTTSWQHIVVTWSSGESIKLYLDGELDVLSSDDGAATGTITGLTQFIIGKGPKDEITSWNGSIDEIKIWNRALSKEEIYQQYISNLQRVNQTHWMLSLNQGKNATEDLDIGTYTYQAFAEDTNNNEASTEQRTIHITGPSPPVPEVSTFYLFFTGLLMAIGLLCVKGGKK